MEVIQKKWSVTNLEISPSFMGRDNVVRTIHWRFVASWNSYESIIIGSKEVSFNDDNYTEYNNLTQELILGWLFSIMTKEEILDIENRAKDELRSAVIDIPDLPTQNVLVTPPWNDK